MALVLRRCHKEVMVSRLSGEWHPLPLQDQASKDQWAVARRRGRKLAVGVVKVRQMAATARPNPT